MIDRTTSETIAAVICFTHYAATRVPSETDRFCFRLKNTTLAIILFNASGLVKKAPAKRHSRAFCTSTYCSAHAAFDPCVVET